MIVLKLYTKIIWEHLIIYRCIDKHSSHKCNNNHHQANILKSNRNREKVGSMSYSNSFKYSLSFQGPSLKLMIKFKLMSGARLPMCHSHLQNLHYYNLVTIKTCMIVIDGHMALKKKSLTQQVSVMKEEINTWLKQITRSHLLQKWFNFAVLTLIKE